jgi:hypothetical protein
MLKLNGITLLGALLLTTSAPADALVTAEASPSTVAHTSGVTKADSATKPRRNRAERTEAFLPSMVSPLFADLDVQNPFDTEQYSVRWAPTGNDAFVVVDDYLASVARLRGTVQLITWSTDQADAGNNELLTPALIGELQSLAVSLPNQVTELPAEGTALITNLPSMLAGPQAMRAPALIRGLRDAIATIADTAVLVPDAVVSAANLVIP